MGGRLVAAALDGAEDLVGDACYGLGDLGAGGLLGLRGDLLGDLLAESFAARDVLVHFHMNM